MATHLQTFFDELEDGYSSYYPPKREEENFLLPLHQKRSLPSPLSNAPISGVLKELIPFTVVMRIPSNKCGCGSDPLQLINFFMRTTDYSSYFFSSTSSPKDNIAYFQLIPQPNPNSPILSVLKNGEWLPLSAVDNQLELTNFINTYFFQPNILNSNTAYRDITFLGFSSPPTLIGDGENGYFTSIEGDVNIPTGTILSSFYFYPIPADTYQYKRVITQTVPGVNIFQEWVLTPSNFLNGSGWLTSSNSNSFSELLPSTYGWYFVGDACFGETPPASSGYGCFYNDMISYNQSVETPYSYFKISTYHQGKSSGSQGRRGVQGLISPPSLPGRIGERGLVGNDGGGEITPSSLFTLIFIMVLGILIISIVLLTYFLNFRKECIRSYKIIKHIFD